MARIEGISLSAERRLLAIRIGFYAATCAPAGAVETRGVLGPHGPWQHPAVYAVYEA